ncbi:phosphogluconate dehydratase [Zhongshania aliphaticivorans]|uniref:phosphogluconate dehydratase n=1 Tax=Zhongshania aliphaticivorans TaxID=1470434 RepID=UPI0012E4FF0A|nr:phosphogluconate dehydratase [Zhongshania aliphaticivorans]CAA0099951.1 Phosphogluconate dehydratase [Zhongshania aliphaticivorans]
MSTASKTVLHPVIASVTERIRARSIASRAAYLEKCQSMRRKGTQRGQLSCSNLAHGFAACSGEDKNRIRLEEAANIAIVSAYNDMLSAHKPLEYFPDLIREAVSELGCTAQFAGGTPAMCDGVTQGAEGMELSLFSRDTIAMSTAIALSHNMFDAVLCLGVCDKIVPGLLIGALSFGHLPMIMVPAGPMSTGLSNDEKARIRQLYAEGKVGREALLDAEASAYHGEGTCTFYGTANSNQMLMEAMGLHVPGTAFVPPNGALREQLTRAAAQQVCKITALTPNYTPLCDVVDERSLVNAIVTLLATGGSTNHSIHWIAIARAAGIIIDWQDFAELSEATPLLCRIYPNGKADVNHFHAAGGTGFIIAELLAAGLLHADVNTVWGKGLQHYSQAPSLAGGKLHWQQSPPISADDTVLRPSTEPFTPHGGMELLTGKLGRSIIKVSAVKAEHRYVKAPAVIFDTQEALKDAFDAGKLDRDFIAVVRFQGPRANGMPELHKLTPYLGILQERGFKVALVTDGRMSGASGKIPAAIHLCPEAYSGGPIAKIQNGDMLILDTENKLLDVLISEDELQKREAALYQPTFASDNYGRDLFAGLRANVSTAEEGAATFLL